MISPILLTADRVEPVRLETFLSRMYPASKSRYLNQHAVWLHHSNSNRLILEVAGHLAGYCAVIPATVWVADEVHNAIWWVDLVIAPEFRGRGLQTIFDRHVRDMSDLLLGFPNPLAAEIHKKHGWGVRNDLRMLMLPLIPLQAGPVQNAQGLRKTLLRSGAAGISPMVFLWQKSILAKNVNSTIKMQKFDSQILFDIVERTHQPQINTTWRSRQYFDHRYAKSPHSDEYVTYLASENENSDCYLILRRVIRPDHVRHDRILDIGGNLENFDKVKALLTFVIQDAIRHGISQITMLASQPLLIQAARRMGFLFSAPVNFCWSSSSNKLMRSLSGDIHWTLADSDNDTPTQEISQ